MIITNSSSLILLAKIGVIDVAITKIKQKLVIPEQVYNECVAKRELFDAQIIKKRIEEGLITKRNISNKKLFEQLLNDFNFGKGEAEALTLCIELKSGLITDDKKAINACKILNIKFTTVPRLIIEFYKRKFITKMEINSIITKLQEYGRYSDDIIHNIKEDLK